MRNFIEKNFIIIVSIFLFLVYFDGCVQKRELTEIKQEISSIKDDITAIKDSSYNEVELTEIINLQVLYSVKMSEMEGLKSELRFYQSTNRTLMDVKRQSEVEKEIKKLDLEINILEKQLYEALDK